MTTLKQIYIVHVYRIKRKDVYKIKYNAKRETRDAKRQPVCVEYNIIITIYYC